MAAIDMAGRRYGKLVVVSRSNNAIGGTARWLCKCDCGGTGIYAGTAIRAGRQKSCGCGMRETMFRAADGSLHLHGMSSSRAYRIWAGMRERCSSNATGKSRRLYYERGVRVCERWQKFENFLVDMGEPPKKTSIDRIDPDGDYEPKNCRWATAEQQANNKRSNCIIEFQGRKLTIAQWAREIGIKQNTLVYRINRGISLERALCCDITPKPTMIKLSRARACESCGATFIPRTTQIRVGQGKFCSHACARTAIQRDAATGRIVRCA